MVRMRSIAQMGFAALSLGLLGASAQAQTSGPFTYTVAQTKTDFTNSSIVLPKFDSSLGTLVSVTLSDTLSGVFGGTVTNTAASAQTFKVTEDVSLSLVTGATPVLTNASDLIAQQTYTSLAPNTPANFGPFTPTTSDSLTLTSGALFNSFNGPGNINFTLSTLTSTTVAGGGGNITSTINTTAGGTVSVIYAYRPAAVPEPGAVAMMVGMGVSGAGFLVRRRKNARK